MSVCLAADSVMVGSDSRKRLCRVISDCMYSDDDDDDDDSLLDSEVSELLRSPSPGLIVSAERSPYKRLRQPDAVQSSAAVTTTPSQARSLHAGAAVASLPRPSLDFYKMQVGCLSVRLSV